MADARELALSIIGRLADGRANPQEFPFESFPAPYNQAIKLIKSHPEMIGNKAEIDILLGQALTYDEIVDAHTQASRLNGLGEDGVFNWAGNMREATDKLTMIPELRRMLRSCEQNDPIDWSSLYAKVGTMIAGKTSGAQPASEIDYSKYESYMKSGIKWMDKIIGGWPTDGVIVVVAPRGTGKSFFQFYTTCMWLLEHPDKTAVIYTLEMSSRHYLSRSLEMYPEFVPLVNSGRLYISGTVRNAEEIIAEVSTKKYGWVGVDDMSKLAKVTTPEKFEMAYSQLNEICRFNEIPVQILAQPNRDASKSNKFIDLTDAAWSSAAENSAAMYLTLNRLSYANPDWVDTRFVPVEKDNSHKTDRFYICYWKFRDNRPIEMQQGIGAVRLEPDSRTGNYKQIWVGEPLDNKLWPVRYTKPTSIGATQQPQPENKPTIRLNMR
jgi:hypothetical protein